MSEVTIGTIVANYNELAVKLGKKPVKKFKDKSTAIKRLNELTKLAGGSGGKRRAPYPWPFIGAQHPLRPNTLRGQIAAALKEGATEAELQALAKKHYAAKEKDMPPGVVADLIKILHSYNGFGIREKDGTLFLVDA